MENDFLKDAEYQVTFTFTDGTAPIALDRIVPNEVFVEEFKAPNIDVSDFHDLEVTFTTNDKFFEEYFAFEIPDSAELLNVITNLDITDDQDIRIAAMAWERVLYAYEAWKRESDG